MTTLLALLVGLVLALTSALSETRSDYDEFERYRVTDGVGQSHVGSERAGGERSAPRAKAGELPNSIIEAIRAYFPEAEWERAECIVHFGGHYSLGSPSPTDDWGPFQLNAPTWKQHFLDTWGSWNPLDEEWSVIAARFIWERAGRLWGPPTNGPWYEAALC